MTSIESITLAHALGEVEKERQAIGKALTIEQSGLSVELCKYLWDRLAQMAKQLRTADSVIPRDDDGPADDWRGVMTL